MQKLLFLIGLVVFPITTIAENFLINPSFDETPWDTGWTMGTSSHNGGASAFPEDTCYLSPSRSCRLCAWASVYNDYCGSYGNIAWFQEIPPAISCTCIVYFKSSIFLCGCSSGASASIFAKINDKWAKQWSTSGNNLNWIRWAKIYGVSDTVSGIKLCASAEAAGWYNYATIYFWIDDVYISGAEVGIEEEEKGKLFKFEAFPNPFRECVFFRYSLGSNKRELPQIIIYDLSGKVVKETLNLNDEANQVIWDGKDKSGKSVATGVYFVRFKMADRKVLHKIIKL